MAHPAVYSSVPLAEHYVKVLEERCDVTCYQGPGQAGRVELIEHLGKAVDGLLATSVLPLDAALLESAPRLRVISNIGVGYDNVDLEVAARRGIVVTHTPGVLSGAVAELTMSLILNLARRLPEAMQAAREGRWDDPIGVGLLGKTLAIIGMGRIGREVARRAAAFGMRVVYHDVLNLAGVDAIATQPATLDEALREADFVSLHANLTAKSRRLIGAREMALMKPGAYLINTSRGAVVDQAALYEALREGRIAGAALDVLEQEPPALNEPLLSLPNVIVTPHIGSATAETRAAMVELAVRNLIACLFGEPCDCVVSLPA